MKTLLSGLFRNPAYLIVGAILLTAAVSLNAATQMLKLYFRKEPVELRQPLTALPERIGHWFQVSRDEPLPHDQEEMLGTKIYISRQYVDLRIAGQEIVSKVKNMGKDERIMLTNQIQMSHPLAVMHVHSTYYTGMVDTVAHIPNRCYIAGGFEPAEEKYQNWDAVSARITPASPFASPFITFEDRTGMRNSRPLNVTYMFNANGKYQPDSESVRLALQDLSTRFSYYAKIELMTVSNDREQSAKVMNEFLVDLLPEVERCLPDWEEVRSRPAK